jgi:hypothetical protein
MKILSLGCSFTRGSELEDPDQTSWPGLLSKKLNAEIDNLAEYNGSNDMMFRKALERSKDYDLIIIGWTEAHRMEVWLNDKIISARRKHPIGPFSVNHNSAGNTLEWVKPFFTNHYNEEYFLRRWLCQVVSLQDHFKLNNQRYLFFTAFSNDAVLSKYDLPLKDKIDTRYYLGWPGQSMMSWTSDTPYGPYGHPLELGHKKTAEKIYEYIRHLGWLP